MEKRWTPPPPRIRISLVNSEQRKRLVLATVRACLPRRRFHTVLRTCQTPCIRDGS